MLADLLRTEQFLLARQSCPPCPLAAADFWRRMEGGGEDTLGLLSALRRFEPRSELARSGGDVFLVPLEPGARPRLRWLRDAGSAAPRVRVGRPSGSHHSALLSAPSLDGLRVRVGVGKGHVFDIVLGLPIDQERDPEALEESFLAYLEHLMGQEFVEDWLGEILIERVPSRRGLTVLSSAGLPPNYALEVLSDLLFRGGLGLSLGRRDPGERDRWVAFELDEGASADAVQPGRTFVSTSVPEVLGPIFAGIPHASRRFFAAHERLVWIEWPADASDRSRHRREIEERVDGLVRSFGGRGVVGTGFGPRADYVDLVIPFRVDVLSELLSCAAELIPIGQLCFYDDEYRELSLGLGAPKL